MNKLSISKKSTSNYSDLFDIESVRFIVDSTLDKSQSQSQTVVTNNWINDEYNILSCYTF